VHNRVTQDMAKVLYFSRGYTTHDHRFLSSLAKTSYQVFYLRLERRGHILEGRNLPPEINQLTWAGGQSPAYWQDGPRLYFSLRKVLHHVKPDLVQAGPLQTAAFLVAATGFRPLVSMSWGYDLLFDAQRNAAWRWATRFALTHSTVMIGDCQTIRQKAVALGMPDENIITFPWGVDLDHFSPYSEVSRDEQLSGNPLHLERDAFILLSTRSWEPLYGILDLAQAFVKVARKHPQLRLVMLGNGSQAGELRRTFLAAGLQDQVIFPGQIRQEDLPRFYRMADLYISSSHSDGTSISLLESLACGTPVLLSDIPGNREWITQPGEVGWLFKDGDIESLTQAIDFSVNNRHKLPTMGLAARKLAETRADWKKNFVNLLEVYDKVLS
jgi:glycosyltransferase involved in cell wall biosynthesis